MKCAVDECPKAVHRRSWCDKHYRRWLKHGDPLQAGVIRNDDEARFWSYIQKTDGCWIWIGPRNAQGYGRWRRFSGAEPAHRRSYERHVGPIPDGMVLDHLCRNPPCVNPEHLEPVSSVENTLRGEGPTATNAAKETCVSGHEFTEPNTYLWKGARHCRECQRRRNRESYQRRKMKADAFDQLIGRDALAAHLAIRGDVPEPLFELESSGL